MKSLSFTDQFSQLYMYIQLRIILILRWQIVAILHNYICSRSDRTLSLRFNDSTRIPSICFAYRGCVRENLIRLGEAPELLELRCKRVKGPALRHHKRSCAPRGSVTPRIMSDETSAQYNRASFRSSSSSDPVQICLPNLMLTRIVRVCLIYPLNKQALAKYVEDKQSRRWTRK